MVSQGKGIKMKKLHKVDTACAVLALWYVSGCGDEDAVLRICTAHGFSVGNGMEDKDWLRAAQTLGINCRQTRMKECRLHKFIKDHPKGLYLVGTWNHLFVVDNGIVIDPRNARPPGLDRIIKHAWKVKK